MKSADVAVIGGGCVGSSIAYSLKRNGVDKDGQRKDASSILMRIHMRSSRLNTECVA